jgi:hypothetical protein
MGTRSTIAIKTPQGIRSIYCHWDGDLDWNGRILKDHYQDEQKVNQLIGLGSISSLQENIGEKHDFDKRYEIRDKKWTTAYGRDRGETDTEAEMSKNGKEFGQLCDARDSEYIYLFRNGAWFYALGREAMTPNFLSRFKRL